MTAITTINATDLITDSRADINTNFANLNSDKIETSAIDTDNTLSADSDAKIPSQKAVKRYIDSNPVRSIPAGVIFDYAGGSVPTGCLLCDGSAVDRTTYADLFAAIGTTWGAGNGSSTFNVPDFRGVALIGAGTGTKVATFVSRSSDTITASGLTNALNNEFQTGQPVFYNTSASVITGLSNNTTYYVIRISNTTFKLASSSANALAGTAITLSGDGSGTQTFTITLVARTLADTGGEENHALVAAEFEHDHSTTNAQNGASSLTEQSVVLDVGAVQGLSASAHNNMMPFKVVTKIIQT